MDGAGRHRCVSAGPLAPRSQADRCPFLRAFLAVAVAGSGLVFWRGAEEVFTTVKATVLWWAAAGMLAAAAVSVARTGRIRVPLTPAWGPVAAFLGGLLFATVSSPQPVASLVGTAGRYTGFASYAACAVVFGGALRVWARRPPTDLVAALLLTAAPVTGYALVQAAGSDPLAWRLVEGGPPVFSTLGNAGFLSAWLGIVTPLSVWAVLCAPWPVLARAACGALAVGAVTAGVVSGSLQGPIAAAAGCLPLLWVVTPRGTARRRIAAGVGSVGGLAALGALAVLATLGALAGPVGALAGSVGARVARSLESRSGKWDAALAMVGDRPLHGVGPAGFADHFPAYVPAADSGVTGRSVDAAHNVLLDIAAGGGVVAALGYAALVAATAAALGGGLRRTSGDRRTLLAALGGAWVAYQLTAMVSIDVPPLAVLHWVLAGAVIATAGGVHLATRSLRPAMRYAVTMGAAVVVCVAVWGAVVPLRAELLTGTALRFEDAGDPGAALQAGRQAAATGRWESRYALNQGGLALRQGRDTEALAAYREAQRRAPRNLAAALGVARVATAVGERAVADAAYRWAAELAPRTPDVLAEAGRHALNAGRPDDAMSILETATRLEPDEPRWWLDLGRARRAAGQRAAAHEALLRAHRLDRRIDHLDDEVTVPITLR